MLAFPTRRSRRDIRVVALLCIGLLLGGCSPRLSLPTPVPPLFTELDSHDAPRLPARLAVERRAQFGTFSERNLAGSPEAKAMLGAGFNVFEEQVRSTIESTGIFSSAVEGVANPFDIHVTVTNRLLPSDNLALDVIKVTITVVLLFLPLLVMRDTAAVEQDVSVDLLGPDGQARSMRSTLRGEVTAGIFDGQAGLNQIFDSLAALNATHVTNWLINDAGVREWRLFSPPHPSVTIIAPSAAPQTSIRIRVENQSLARRVLMPCCTQIRNAETRSWLTGCRTTKSLEPGDVEIMEIDVEQDRPDRLRTEAESPPGSPDQKVDPRERVSCGLWAGDTWLVRK